MTDKHEITAGDAPDETSSNDKKLAECKKEVDSAYAVLGKDQAEYDKQILTLSATFLGLSVAFVKDIVPLDQAVSVRFYDWAVSLLFVSIVFVLGTYQYSIRGQFALIDYWNKQETLAGGPPFESPMKLGAPSFAFFLAKGGKPPHSTRAAGPHPFHSDAGSSRIAESESGLWAWRKQSTPASQIDANGKAPERPGMSYCGLPPLRRKKRKDGAPTVMGIHRVGHPPFGPSIECRRVGWHPETQILRLR